MAYRCPYCKTALGDDPPPKCSSCGRIMRVPRQKELNPRLAKQRVIDAIWRENEQKKAELHGSLPVMGRNSKFYIGAVLLLAVLGGVLFRATDSAVQKRQESPYQVALRHVDVLAEALGRYRFHVGCFPNETQGLAALVRDPHVPKWDGPYINLLRNDPWDTPFVYRPGTNGLPVLFSCGPDKRPGTADDLKPDPVRFDPGTDWTNGWVSSEQRLPGVTVLPSLP